MLKFIRKYFTFNKENHYAPLQTSKFVIGLFLLILIFNFGLETLNCYLIKQNSLTASLNTINIITEINKIRVANGLAPLIENPKLDIAALLKAQDMIANDYFNHYSPTGKTPWDWFSAAQYNYSYAGENLALNFWNDQETVQAWLDSPTHKENILNPNYKETGLAILSGTTSTTKENRTVVVQMFGSEKIAKVTKVKPLAITTTTTKQIKATTTSTSTTTEPIEIANTKIVNSTISNIPIAQKENEKTLLKNISSTIYTQSENKNRSLALGVNMLQDNVINKNGKTINNSFGLGLLFLGIFGIININSQSTIANTLKRKLILKNAFVLFIGLGFLLNNLSILITKIKVPTL